MGITDFIALILASGVGFGLSCWIFGAVLDKSNNIGDYKGDRGKYDAYPAFSARRDGMSSSEYSSFTYMNSKNIDTGKAPKGTELVRKLTPEERKLYAKSKVPTGDFSSSKSGITGKRSFVDEYEKWEKETNCYGKLSGVFKPIEEENPDRAGY